MEAHRGRATRAAVVVAIMTLTVGLFLAVLGPPALAGPAFHKHLQPSPHSSGGTKYALDGHFTESYRHGGWIQAYGVVKVRNKGSHKMTMDCTVTLKTGGVAIGVATVDLVVPKHKTRTTTFGIEAGDESGKLTGAYRCHS